MPPLDKTSDSRSRAVTGTFAGMSGVAGGGLLALGLVLGWFLAWGFSCAGGMDNNSGPYGGEFGLVSFCWLVITCMAGPVALAAAGIGAGLLLASAGFGWAAFGKPRDRAK